MYPAVLAALVAHSSYAQSQAPKFSTEASGEYTLIVPQPSEIKVARQPNQNFPDCAAVEKVLIRNEEGIRRCTAEGVRPNSYCRLLVSDLRRKLLGITNEAFNQREADAAQSWQFSIPQTQLSAAVAENVATETNRVVDQIALPRTFTTSLRSVEWKHTEKSRVPAIKLLNDPDLTNMDLTQNESGETLVQTNSRLISCELQSGTTMIIGKVITSASFSVPAETEKMEFIWSLLPKLEAIERMPLNDSLKFVLTGHRMAQHAVDSSAELPDSELIALSRIALYPDEPRFRTQKYANKFQIGAKLPQRTLDIQGEVTVWGRVQ
jgi:hypothetical protein